MHLIGVAFAVIADSAYGELVFVEGPLTRLLSPKPAGI